MFVLTIPNLDLEQIYQSAQDYTIRRVFGFERSGFLFTCRSCCTKVEQVSGNRFLFSCTDEDFYNIWFDYFDLSTDYSVLSGLACSATSSNVVRHAARKATGIHVLRQDPFEVILRELLFQGRTIREARDSINAVKDALSDEKGKAFKGYGYTRYKLMPSPERFEHSLDVLQWHVDDETLSRCAVLMEWLETHGKLIDPMVSHGSDEVRRELKKLGLSPHKISRVMAYGYGFHDVPCVSPKMESILEWETGCEVGDLIDYDFPHWEHKAAYLGTILAREQSSKNTW